MLEIALTVAIGCGFVSPGPSSPSSRSGGACDLGGAERCFEAGLELLRGAHPDLAGAARRLEAACADGHARACTDLALQLQDGRGVERDPQRAQQLYEAACEQGLGVGCLNLAYLHQTGNAGIADEERATEAYGRALDRFRASCALPQPSYCANLGYMLEHGFGVTLPDPRGAMDAYALGCDHGESDACTNLALASLDRGDPDADRSVQRLQAACEAGSGAGCGGLGQLLYRGQPEDRARAVASFGRGCALANAAACSMLGAVLTLGEGVSPDPVRATDAQTRACALGSSAGCMALAGQALSEHQAGEVGAAERAAAHLASACYIGDASGCTLLGRMVRSGDLGAADTEAATRWFAEGCRRSDGASCVELLRAGRALPLNGRALDAFVEEACAQGIEEACNIAP